MHIAVFAKAPRAGASKTRLIPVLGAVGAARLQRQMTLRTLALARGVDGARVTLWCAPDRGERFFRALARAGVPTRTQQGADLGARMAGAFVAVDGPMILIGCDCPALQREHLTRTVALLEAGHDAVFIAAEDGGYVLVALRRPHARIFEDIDWGGERVMAQTRSRLRELGLSWAEPATLWDVDRPADLDRLAALASPVLGWRPMFDR